MTIARSQLIDVSGYRAVYTYRDEDVLDSLRSRDDFRLLMMDLAMPVEPFAPDTDGHR
jgi:hypothetical protein